MPKKMHIASEDDPIITRYEPGFRRTFVKGSVVRVDPDDPEILYVGLWSSKKEGIEYAEGKTATGYALEFETAMTWRAAERLHALLGQWIKVYRPDLMEEDGDGPEETA